MDDDMHRKADGHRQREGQKRIDSCPVYWPGILSGQTSAFENQNFRNWNPKVQPGQRDGKLAGKVLTLVLHPK